MDIEKSCFLVCDWFHTLEACLEISGVFVYFLTLGVLCGPLNSVRTPETFNKCLGIVI